MIRKDLKDRALSLFAFIQNKILNHLRRVDDHYVSQPLESEDTSGTPTFVQVLEIASGDYIYSITLTVKRGK